MSKIAINASELLLALKKLAPAITVNPTLPVLENVYFSCGSKDLWLEATNLAVSIRTKIDQVETGGITRFLLPYKKLVDFLSQCRIFLFLQLLLFLV